MTHKSTRNTGLRSYHHDQAHRMPIERRLATAKSYRMEAELIDKINDILKQSHNYRRMENTVKIYMALILLLISFQAAATDYVSPLTTDTTKNNLTHHEIISQITHIKYPVHVVLPKNYNTTQKKYPIIYMTDGQWSLDAYWTQEELKKDVILIAIEQGPKNRRNVDYVENMEDYLQFLTRELIPFIESRYPVDGDKRALLGTSFGGVLIGYTLFRDRAENPFFATYASFDGSYWIGNDYFKTMSENRYKLNSHLSATLFLTGAKRGNAKSVSNFKKMLEDQNFEGLTIIETDFNVKHEAIFMPSIKKMLEDLY